MLCGRLNVSLVPIISSRICLLLGRTRTGFALGFRVQCALAVCFPPHGAHRPPPVSEMLYKP